MRVYKCDRCRKTLNSDDKGNLDVRAEYKNYEFCPKCAEPVARVLKRYKLSK